MPVTEEQVIKKIDESYPDKRLMANLLVYILAEDKPKTVLKSLYGKEASVRAFVDKLENPVDGIIMEYFDEEMVLKSEYDEVFNSLVAMQRL